MTGEEHNEIIEQLAKAVTPEKDDGTVAVLLAKLRYDYTQTIVSLADGEAKVKDLTEKNEKLRAGNLELLLSKGETVRSEINQPPVVEEEIKIPTIEEIAKEF